MSDEDFGAPKKDRRKIAIALCLVAAACMAYAAFSHRWLSNGNKHLQYGMGLQKSFECAKSDSDWDCTWIANADLVKQMKEMQKYDPAHRKLYSAAWIPAGWITLIAILLSSLGLIASAGLAIRKVYKEWPVAPTTVALLGGMVGLISGCVFVATKPGEPGMVGVGLSFWLFGIGVVMGIVGAQMMAKVIRPPDQEWTA
jgi:hypothetical protein